MTFWDSLHDAPTRNISCVWCKSSIEVPWTTTGEALRYFVRSSREVCETIDSEGLGFADAKLDVKCQRCGADNNRDALEVQKELHDVNLLLRDDVPLAGTVVSTMSDSNVAIPTQVLQETQISFQNA